MLFLKKNYIVKRNFLHKKLFLDFKNELNLIINKIIKKNKLPISKKSSIDHKLLSLEEIDHKYISYIYSEIKNSKVIIKFQKSKYLLLYLRKIFKKKFENHTKSVRIDLSNNLKWNLNWHQETSFNPIEDKDKIFIYLWFPIINSSYEVGGLDIYSRLTKKAYGYKIIKKKNSQIQKLPTKKINKKDKNIKQIKLNLGDILFFDKFLFHRSVVNTSLKAKLSCSLSFKTAI